MKGKHLIGQRPGIIGVTIELSFEELLVLERTIHEAYHALHDFRERVGDSQENNCAIDDLIKFGAKITSGGLDLQKSYNSLFDAEENIFDNRSEGDYREPEISYE